MAFLSPEEIQFQALRRRMGGYDAADVDRLLESVAASYEQVWRERDELREQVQKLDEELANVRELERLLRDALVTAQRARDDLLTQAEWDSAVVLEESRKRAEEIVGDAKQERDQLQADVARLKLIESELDKSYRAFLLTALELLEGRERESDGTPFPELPATTIREAAARAAPGS